MGPAASPSGAGSGGADAGRAAAGVGGEEVEEATSSTEVGEGLWCRIKIKDRNLFSVQKRYFYMRRKY